MPLARAPMPFVTVAQEKRDFKIFVILITELSQVRILPYIRQDVCQLVWSPRDAASRRTFGYG